VRFQFLTAVNVKMAAFWVIAPYSLVETDRRFRGVYCLYRSDDAGSTLLWNVGLLQRDCTALYPRNAWLIGEGRCTLHLNTSRYILKVKPNPFNWGSSKVNEQRVVRQLSRAAEQKAFPPSVQTTEAEHILDTFNTCLRSGNRIIWGTTRNTWLNFDGYNVNVNTQSKFTL
jgi:hypothetical protein